MRSSLVLLLSIVASVAATPLQDTLNGRLFPRDKDAFPVSTETEIVTGKDATNQPAKKQSEKADGGTKDSKGLTLVSLGGHDEQAGNKYDAPRSPKPFNEARDKITKRTRKHKAIFINHPIVEQPPFSNAAYVLEDSMEDDSDIVGRTRANLNRFQESDIFYIRLPPAPYMFVPGFGYISQPPTYSTASLRPHTPYARPGKPKPANPFINLPIDFVSNGKPTSVYHWQKKTNKKPTDSPITNLDSLSADFVNNGKPTSIYQWQANLKPINKPDDFVNNLDKGPYVFNGKLASFFLLKSDGTPLPRQPILYPDYQQHDSYYRSR
ncbi:uncharacterized protein LOC143432214 [Xylocopa sonorina]|uniref:uncharacterized protein LOC143423859 n=1 Tax=Xylocopa sonorina TaxID=1818115 RepID=UPI00403A914B